MIVIGNKKCFQFNIIQLYPFITPSYMSRNYVLQGLNFEKFGQIEYSLDKIKAKMFFLHRHLLAGR